VKAVVIDEPNKVSVKTVSEPSPAANQALIKV